VVDQQHTAIIVAGSAGSSTMPSSSFCRRRWAC